MKCAKNKIKKTGVHVSLSPLFPENGCPRFPTFPFPRFHFPPRFPRFPTFPRFGNLLGGRAWRFELFPLTTQDLGKYKLERILNHGMIPLHYAEDMPERSLRSYVLDY
jgi:hypothetical protein